MKDRLPVPAESPTARNKNAAPRTAPAIPFAARALWLSWEVTAATAAKPHPAEVKPSPRAKAPAAGSPRPVRAAPSATPTSKLIPNASPRAAVSGANLPTRPEPTSSSLPLSSWAGCGG